MIHASFPEVFFSHHDDQRVSGGRFRGPLWSACGGSLVLIRRLLARWLLRYFLRSLRSRCLLGRSVQLLRCCNVEDLHQAPSATRVWSEVYWAGDASDLCTRCCSGSGNPLCWEDTRQHGTCCRFSFQSVIKQDADIRENLYAIIVFMRGKIAPFCTRGGAHRRCPGTCSLLKCQVEGPFQADTNEVCLLPVRLDEQEAGFRHRHRVCLRISSLV